MPIARPMIFSSAHMGSERMPAVCRIELAQSRHLELRAGTAKARPRYPGELSLAQPLAPHVVPVNSAKTTGRASPSLDVLLSFFQVRGVHACDWREMVAVKTTNIAARRTDRLCSRTAWGLWSPFRQAVLRLLPGMFVADAANGILNARAWAPGCRQRACRPQRHGQWCQQHRTPAL
jgi:hypothetical protein